jgi:protoporphyrin/coproporphyrin ferrochelatase
MKPDAVLLIGYGGPEKPEEVVPFIEDVTRGKHIPPERLKQAARQYEQLGGSSPYNRLTLEQAEALDKLLKARGLDLPVRVGFAHSRPSIADALAKLSEPGKKNIFIIVMAPHRSPASYDKYAGLVDEALASLKARSLPVPEITYAPEWHNHPGFIQAIVQHTKEAIGGMTPVKNHGSELVFTAHSIPQVMAHRCPYLAQFEETARLAVNQLGVLQYQKAFTSRSGQPGESWLEPDLGDLLERMGENGVKTCVVVPIGFLVDHMEVLYDIGILARERALKAGVQMVSARTVGAHPSFIAMLSSLVEESFT